MEKIYRLEKGIIDVYFQKSYKLLYPILQIRKRDIVPLQTFIQWTDYYTEKDKKLIAIFELDYVYNKDSYYKDEIRFKTFEKDYLFSNKYFDSFIECEDNKGAYLFDFKELSADWSNFLVGAYSKFTPESKKRILNYYSANRFNAEYMQSYLEPENFFGVYSKLLGIPENYLRDVGELCSLPDMDRETYELQKKESAKLNAEMYG